MQWEPDRASVSAAASVAAPPGSMWTALWRGARNHCPVCDQGKVFDGYLTVVPACSHCGAPLGRMRADDAPPYFVILITGHLLVPLALFVEKTWQPPMWLHMAIWLPLFTLFCLALLRPVKGAVVGGMMRLGFGDTEPPVEDQRLAVSTDTRPRDA